MLFADWGINIRAPTGEVLKISKYATFQGGRIQSLNKVICFICLFFKLNINNHETSYFQCMAAVLEYPTLTKRMKESGGEHTYIKIR